MAAEDKLTGIPNRRRFDETLDRQWRQAARMGIPLSLILVDIDHFKKFNDRYGHLAGDDCLKQVAQALAKNVKRAGDLVARYGGEELVVLLFHMTRDDTRALAERLWQAVADLGIPHKDSATGHGRCFLWPWWVADAAKRFAEENVRGGSVRLGSLLYLYPFTGVEKTP